MWSGQRAALPTVPRRLCVSALISCESPPYTSFDWFHVLLITLTLSVNSDIYFVSVRRAGNNLRAKSTVRLQSRQCMAIMHWWFCETFCNTAMSRLRYWCYRKRGENRYLLCVGNRMFCIPTQWGLGVCMIFLVAEISEKQSLVIN